jgi:acyl carrier protein
MTKEAILQRIAAILARQFNIEPGSVNRDTSAYDVDGWDSVSHVYVILEVERRFAIKAPEERVFQLENVGELVDLIAELRNAG